MAMKLYTYIKTRVNKHEYIHPKVNTEMEDTTTIIECQKSIGHDVWELLNKGSHNDLVVNTIKSQPYEVQKAIFEKLNWNCGKERLLYLQERVWKRA
jgi:hypothetical protein